jgi:hypothetical protein
MTATGEDGKFRLGPLPAGEYQISVLAESPRRATVLRVRAGEAKIVRLGSTAEEPRKVRGGFAGR